MSNKGYFGDFGGQYVHGSLKASLEELANCYYKYRDDQEFNKELLHYLKVFSGRPTSLYFAENLTEKLGGAKIYLKREDLNHLGAHKINNTIGQILLAKKMGKKEIVAETGAGQHGVATAAVSAKFGFKCTIFMGELDAKKQPLNVFRMELLGAKVVKVNKGNKNLNDAVNEALNYWIEHYRNTHYLLGSCVGPHPFPTIVKDFQSIIGREAKEQIIELEGKLPNHVVACIGGGSNAIGIFTSFLDHPEINLYGVEAGGISLDDGNHSATLSKGQPGILHGSYSYFLKDSNNKPMSTHSISSGLDYPGVGPEHAYFKSENRVNYVAISDHEAVKAYQDLSFYEGIIPALESSHALAYLYKLAPQLTKDELIVLNLSGRGDKDVEAVSNYLDS
ncbi:tryptophan synthase subunit beta [Natranaerobius trueperi]|uniref:Tryptophan synthase beta chain n=1 Tax=Natranaerobius trueperi TaxID=759412 RepID=A0A226BV82_9FIRM|nr:tryptophan synthase subunit beta [Natranaerobius trueperi]OWZ82885.1 tryptophan synthase subunit beta [Natranaerobius trueperi]